MVDKDLRAGVPEPQKADYDRAATGALAALKEFNTFLEKDLSNKKSDWRLGKEKYTKKFEYVLVTGKTPEQLLVQGERELPAEPPPGFPPGRRLVVPEYASVQMRIIRRGHRASNAC